LAGGLFLLAIKGTAAPLELFGALLAPLGGHDAAAIPLVDGPLALGLLLIAVSGAMELAARAPAGLRRAARTATAEAATAPEPEAGAPESAAPESTEPAEPAAPGRSLRDLIGERRGGRR
jgi:hypothetical protein